MQNTEYDPWAENEPEIARKLDMHWQFRGPLAEDAEYWGNQKRRANGRFSNNGGFKKRAQLVFNASARDFYFSLSNPSGPTIFIAVAVVRVVNSPGALIPRMR